MVGSGQNTGLLIAVEGIDGAGKTTQVERLVAALTESGEEVVRSKEPTNGEHGKRLRESAQSGRMTAHDELRTFLADRREHVSTLIEPALSGGKLVVLDRYFYSTIAYQGARLFKTPCELYEMMREFPIPDVTFLLDVPPEIGLHRIENTRGDVPNEFERLESLGDIRRNFLALLECAPELYVVDGLPPINFVYHDIAHKLVEILKSKRCVKPYDCDMLLCSYRITGECTWPTERAKLLAH